MNVVNVKLNIIFGQRQAMKNGKWWFYCCVLSCAFWARKEKPTLEMAPGGVHSRLWRKCLSGLENKDGDH